MCSRSRTPTTCSGSNAARTTAAPPWHTTESAAGMTAAWNIGSTTRPRSPGPAVWARWTWTTLAVTAPWLRTAPFGAPVVPLVYISLERIGSAHVHGRWRGASLGEPPFQRLPATGAGRSFGYGGVDALELRADLVDGGDSCRSTMRTDGCASVKSRPTRAAQAAS